MTNSATLCLLLWASLGAYADVTASVRDEGKGRDFNIRRRNVYESSNETLHISGLQALVHGGNRATVKWESATGPVTGYEINVCLLRERPRCESAQSEKTSQKLQHLESGASYEVEVRAYIEADGKKTKGRKEKIGFTTAQVPTVDELQAIRVKATSIELSWAATNGSVSHFDIDVCPTGGGACVHAYTEDVSHLLEGLTPETTYNIHVRSVTERDKELSFGAPSNISATTVQLPELYNVSVRATCDSFIIASWDYSDEGITGFLLNLYADGHSRVTTTVDKADRVHSFKVDPTHRQYTLSVEAYLWQGNTKYSSAVVNVSVASYPEVPRLDGFEVDAVSLREVRATWKAPIETDVRLYVCPLESQRKTCVNYVAHGTQLAFTIGGLSPSTKYSIEASGAVTFGANTCLGLGITREITTLTEAVCRYDEELKVALKDLTDNVRALTQRQNDIEAREEGNVIHAMSKTIEEKLKPLSEKDLADCLEDIDKLIEEYKKKMQ